MSDKPKYSFKCLEQKCETSACHTRPEVNVTLGDISRWTTQNYLQHILPGVSLHMPKSENDLIAIEMARKPLQKDSEKTACIFYHQESNGCQIRYSRPISCRTYPLQYDGEKYKVIDKECPGVGKGEITKEALREHKELAEQDYKERLETSTVLPSIYAIFMGQMIKQSTEAMQGLSEEDRKRLEEIMEKSDGKEENESSEE
ncbi:MAG: YkgJ family cysteine cluster protein [Candidatus Thorarchaeota archaeon]|jgi:Fe-S-cluster containining protein